jgi:hypothetical protein
MELSEKFWDMAMESLSTGSLGSAEALVGSELVFLKKC